MKRKDALKWWHEIPSEKVLGVFAGLPGARRSKTWVYVEGERAPDSRLLLVAHSDTVQPEPPPGLRWEGNVLTGNQGTGSDDRAGCAILWELQGSGHSLLICDLEESGGIGASDALRELGKEVLGKHCFALEFDRRGDGELVTYPGTSSEAFGAYLKETFPGWTVGTGSYTDICDLCPGVGICGANIGVGYLFQHTSSEILILDAWERTLETVGAILGRSTFPRHEPEARTAWKSGQWRAGVHGYGEWWDRPGYSHGSKRSGGRSQSDERFLWGETSVFPDRSLEEAGTDIIRAPSDDLPVVGSNGKAVYSIRREDVPAWVVGDDGTIEERLLLLYWERVGTDPEDVDVYGDDWEAEDDLGGDPDFWGDVATWKRESGADDLPKT
jgi:hypothetical protein